MMVNRNDEAVMIAHNEHPHNVIRTVCMHGTSQQVIRNGTGATINEDYELLHYIDQLK